MIELGYKDFTLNGSIGTLAPAGTPDAIFEKLHREIAKAVESEEIRRQYRNLALDPVTPSPVEYREDLVRETAKYERIARDARIEKE